MSHEATTPKESIPYWKKELNSWKTPSPVPIADPPSIGSQAPSSAKLELPAADGKPTIITFLRHCGCPFAEKTFLNLRRLAGLHADEAHFIAVSHSDDESTEKWIIAVGGEWATHVIVDEKRELFGAWGLGASSAWHVLNPWSLYSVWKLGKKEKIWNRPTESGNRWQTSGSFAVDGQGLVKWANVAKAADDISNFDDALATVGIKANAKRNSKI